MHPSNAISRDGCVYIITHEETQYVYVGSFNPNGHDYTLYMRYMQHYNDAKKQNNKSSEYMFSFNTLPSITILENFKGLEITVQELRETEQEWIDTYAPWITNKVNAVYDYQAYLQRRNYKERNDPEAKQKKKERTSRLVQCRYCEKHVRYKDRPTHEREDCKYATHPRKSCQYCYTYTKRSRMKDHLKKVCRVYHETSEHCYIFTENDIVMKQCTLCHTTFEAKNNYMMKDHDKHCIQQ